MNFLSSFFEKKPEHKHFCPSCGAVLDKEANFCSKCGKQINNSVSITSQTVENRRIQYIKCPNCGSNMSALDATCPHCGLEIIGKQVATSVQAFANALAQIESERKTQKKPFFSSEPAKLSDTALRTISLIKTYPIPNTVEEIMEFMFLAEANIDTSLSKRTLLNKLNKSPTWAPPRDDQFISDAWVAKMQQIYRKAEISFSHTTMFAKIKEIYENKMNELKIPI